MAELREVATGHVTADTAIVTTGETLVVTSDEILVPQHTVSVWVQTFVQLTTGAGTTSVTPRVRRGATTGGVTVDDAVAIAIAAVAGSNEQFVVYARDEDLAGRDTVQYSLTVQQVGATGNGTILQAGIIVMLLA